MQTSVMAMDGCMGTQGSDGRPDRRHESDTDQNIDSLFLSPKFAIAIIVFLAIVTILSVWSMMA